MEEETRGHAYQGSRRGHPRIGCAIWQFRRAAAAFAQANAQVSTQVSTQAVAGDAGSFFAGKRIQLVIGWEVGGGYDIYARLLARHLGKHIPGNPAIVPQNMPGAGSRQAANWLYNIAPKDGTAIATIGQGTPLDQAMNDPGVRYDAAKLNWIGNPIIDNLVTAVTQRTGVETLDDLKRKGGVICGDVGAGPTSTFPEILNQLLGTRNRIIAGFPGVNSVHLAMERGEVDCIGGTTWSSMKATAGRNCGTANWRCWCSGARSRTRIFPTICGARYR